MSPKEVNRNKYFLLNRVNTKFKKMQKTDFEKNAFKIFDVYILCIYSTMYILCIYSVVYICIYLYIQAQNLYRLLRISF